MTTIAQNPTIYRVRPAPRSPQLSLLEGRPMGMLQALGAVCREVREAAEGRKTTEHIAIHMEHLKGSKAQTIDRFEDGTQKPRALDALVEAYSLETGVSPLEIWSRALERYAAESLPTSQLPKRARQAAEDAVKQPPPSKRESAPKRRTKRRRGGG